MVNQGVKNQGLKIEKFKLPDFVDYQLYSREVKDQKNWMYNK